MTSRSLSNHSTLRSARGQQRAMAMAAAFMGAFARKALPSARLDDLSAVLASAYDRARRKWPGIEVEPEGFARLLGKRVASAESALAALTSLRTSDLYIAHAALNEVPGAVDQIVEKARPDLVKTLQRLRLSAADIDELIQRTITHVFVAEKSDAKRLASYTGGGSITAWLATVATRLAVDSKRSEKSVDDVNDERLAGAIAAAGDTELDFLKVRYRREFREAFQASFGELTPEERNLIRMVFLDGMTVDDLAPMLGVHRATVARRLARARETLQVGTRKRLKERFKLSGSELDSLVRLVTSAFDVSLSQVLTSRRSIRGVPRGLT